MNKEQMKKQLRIMKEMLQDMRQERIEAGAAYSDTSEFIQQLDADISLAVSIIRGYKQDISRYKENK